MKHVWKPTRSLLAVLTACTSLSALTASGQTVPPPAPYGALPSQGQLQWHEMEMYNMIEFNQINYLDKDWGWGDESPEIVNPVNFNAEEIVLRAKKAGSKGFLINAKHHGGFCMWPSRTTDYNISRSPWRNGKGDWVGEWEAACRKHGLKFGVYLSPWDRNTAKFGTPEYLDMFKAQLRELLTQYGDLFIIWFDGAPGEGGDGYYGGANEYRGGFLDYYDWENIYALCRELQPNAVIFGDPGPDVRWVGNEKGYAGETCWATLFAPGEKWNGRPIPTGSPEHRKRINEGNRNGQYWIPAEADFSLRRRFTWHASDSLTVKTPQKLFDIYINSVGRGQGWDLNLPINPLGEQDEPDKLALEEFGRYLEATFRDDLTRGATLHASNVRGGDEAHYGTALLTDGDRYSYWATDDKVTSAELVLDFPRTETFNIIKLRENIKLGQRIDSVKVDMKVGGTWKEIAGATSIGACRLIRLKNYVETSSLRIRFYAPVALAVSEVGCYKEPDGAVAPVISRTKAGEVSLQVERPVYQLRYTTDGSVPSVSSPLYTGPFTFAREGAVRAVAFDKDCRKGEEAVRTFDACKRNWRILTADGQPYAAAGALVDDDDQTFWRSPSQDKDAAFRPQSLVIDLGETQVVKGFSYTPRQDNSSEGVIDRLALMASEDGKNWTPVYEDFIPNIRQAPVYRSFRLKTPVSCRYLKLTALRVLEGNYATGAEFGILLK
mgnify:FL=1